MEFKKQNVVSTGSSQGSIYVLAMQVHVNAKVHIKSYLKVNKKWRFSRRN